MIPVTDYMTHNYWSRHNGYVRPKRYANVMLILSIDSEFCVDLNQNSIHSYTVVSSFKIVDMIFDCEDLDG